MARTPTSAQKRALSLAVERSFFYAAYGKFQLNSKARLPGFDSYRAFAVGDQKRLDKRHE